MNLKTHRVIVTGGSKGIGKAIARAFALQESMVMIVDTDNENGNITAREIQSEGGKVWFFQADISKPHEIIELVKAAVGRLGGLDILVNNAGFGIRKSPEELSVDKWDSVININLRGTFLCSREAIPFIENSGGGTIINIASTRALMSEPDSEAYAASKGGILALTHALAASCAGKNIRVNCISPGWIETGDYSKLSETDHSQHLSGRVGKPSDISSACLWLAENEFINGENIVIDGGMTRKMIYEP